MGQQRNRCRAALWAALLFVAALAVVPFGLLEAKTRVDRLWIVTADGREIPLDVEIAEDAKQKALGLMFRTELADDKGMLFPYEELREISMWMHNTYISLDMLFIRPDGVIHRIESRAEPMSDRVIESGGPVSAVLELAGGAAERLGIKPGDKVRHPIFGAAKP